MTTLDEKVRKFGEFHSSEAVPKPEEIPFTNGSSAHQRFLVRIVLHRTDGNNEYEELHEAMDNLGFRKIINGAKPELNIFKSHKLPGGLYYHDRGYFLNPYNNRNLQEGYERVKKAVQEVVAQDPTLYKANMPPSIFIAEINMALWSGLEEAPK